MHSESCRQRQKQFDAGLLPEDTSRGSVTPSAGPVVPAPADEDMPLASATPSEFHESDVRHPDYGRPLPADQQAGFGPLRRGSSSAVASGGPSRGRRRSEPYDGLEADLDTLLLGKAQAKELKFSSLSSED